MLEWEEMYNLVRIYIINHQTTYIEESFKTIDGINYDENGYEIGKWLKEQITEYKKKTMSYKKAKKIKQLNLFKTSRSINNDKKWEEMYNIAKTYYDYNGNLEVPINFKTKDGITYDINGKNLYTWINNQKHKKRNNNLSVEKISKLNSIHIIWKANNKRWCKMYNIAKSYYERYGNCCIPIDALEQYKKQLEDWLIEQQDAYNKGTLTEAKINNLNSIGIDLNEDDIDWNKKYELLKKYKEFYNNIDIENGFKTKDGINYDEQGTNLYNWVVYQRLLYKKNKLKLYKIINLNQLGLIWDCNRKKWEDAYELAKKYYEHSGNLKVPLDFKTKDGINYDENGFSLGLWINRQKKSYSNVLSKKLSEEEIDKLNKIHIIWNNNDKAWNDNYELAKKYYEHNGNLKVPKNFKTKDGITYDETGTNLYNWILRQRLAYQGFISYELNDEQIDKLNKIKMIWSISDYNWNKKYEFVINYYNKNRNLNIPKNFKTKDGITYDETGTNLYTWLVEQIRLYNNYELSKDKKEKIEKIVFMYKCSKNSFSKKKITKKNLLEIKGQLLDILKVKLEEYNGKEINSIEDIKKINNDFAKVFSSNK